MKIHTKPPKASMKPLTPIKLKKNFSSSGNKNKEGVDRSKVKKNESTKKFKSKKQPLMQYSIKNLIKANSTKFRAKEIKATFSNEYHQESAYNTFIRAYNEFILLAHQYGEKVGMHSRYFPICKQLGITRVGHDVVSNFKLEALNKFNQLLMRENQICPQFVESNGEEEMKTPQLQKIFKAYIGKGNNWIVVKNTLKYRNWWTISKKFIKQDTNFVWTQWLKDKILNNLPKNEVESLELIQNKCKTMYNRLEGTTSISNKKDLFINLTNYYKATNQEPLENIPLTFLIRNGIKDESFYNFSQFHDQTSSDGENYWIIKPGENSNRGKGIQL